MHVAEGYGWAPLLKWGDPIHAIGPEVDPLNQSAEKQRNQIGYNCDCIGCHPVGGDNLVRQLVTTG